jgi:hypothetical protein
VKSVPEEDTVVGFIDVVFSSEPTVKKRSTFSSLLRACRSRLSRLQIWFEVGFESSQIQYQNVLSKDKRLSSRVVSAVLQCSVLVRSKVFFIRIEKCAFKFRYAPFYFLSGPITQAVLEGISTVSHGLPGIRFVNCINNGFLVLKALIG